LHVPDASDVQDVPIYRCIVASLSRHVSQAR